MNELDQELGQKAADFMLEKIIEHAKNQGMQAVALLRPEHNPDLSMTHWQEQGLSTELLASVRSQFYAGTRRMGFKKIKGSKYLWLFFGQATSNTKPNP